MGVELRKKPKDLSASDIKFISLFFSSGLAHELKKAKESNMVGVCVSLMMAMATITVGNGNEIHKQSIRPWMSALPAPASGLRR